MKKALAFALALVLALSFVACGTTASSSAPVSGATGDSTSASEPAATGAGLYPGTVEADAITVNLGAEPPDLVSVTTTTTGSGDVLRPTVVGLTELDENDKPYGEIAESWESAPNEDGVEDMVWTFHLRDDYKWYSANEELNGLPVTAHDFVYAWTLALTPETGAQYNYMCYIFKNGEKFFNGECGIEDVGFKAIDDYTLQVELENPIPYLLSQLTFYTFKPLNQQAYETIGEDAYNREAESFVGNGPYKMTEWVHEDRIVLEKNPDYPKADEIGVNKVTMLMIKDTNTAMNAFKAGEVDMIGLNGDQTVMLEAEGQPILTYNDNSTWYFQYNTTVPGLNNAKVRKALTMAVDRETYIKNVVKDRSTVATYFTSSAIDGVDGKFVDTLADAGISFEYDVEAAKALLEEGLAEENMTLADFNAQGYQITTDDTDTALRDCQYFQEQWKTNLGVEVGIEQMTYEARVAATHEGNYEISLFGWGPDYNDPMTFLDLWVTGGGNNDSRYANPAYDELIEKARAEADPAVRESYFIEAERILNEDMPCGPIYNRQRNYVLSDKVTGITRTGFQNIDVTTAELTA